MLFLFIVMEFTDIQIKEATENFSGERKLGQRGFGCVYRGFMNGSNVAIKVLSEVCIRNN